MSPGFPGCVCRSSYFDQWFSQGLPRTSGVYGTPHPQYPRVYLSQEFPGSFNLCLLRKKSENNTAPRIFSNQGSFMNGKYLLILVTCYLLIFVILLLKVFLIVQILLLLLDKSKQSFQMLGKIEDRRRRKQQRMRWLDGITDSMDMTLSKV